MKVVLAMLVAVCACGGDDSATDDDVDVSSDEQPADDAIEIDAPASPIPPDAILRETIMETVPLDVNDIVEAVIVAGPADYARITATVPTPSFDWNIHSHPNGETIVLAEALRVSAMDYVLHPADQADWYQLLRNKGQTSNTITLQVELYNNATWSGWQ
jgi:hypothetical protein